MYAPGDRLRQNTFYFINSTSRLGMIVAIFKTIPTSSNRFNSEFDVKYTGTTLQKTIQRGKDTISELPSCWHTTQCRSATTCFERGETRILWTTHIYCRYKNIGWVDSVFWLSANVWVAESIHEIESAPKLSNARWRFLFSRECWQRWLGLLCHFCLWIFTCMTDSIHYMTSTKDVLTNRIYLYQ